MSEGNLELSNINQGVIKVPPLLIQEIMAHERRLS